MIEPKYLPTENLETILADRIGDQKRINSVFAEYLRRDDHTPDIYSHLQLDAIQRHELRLLGKTVPEKLTPAEIVDRAAGKTKLSAAERTELGWALGTIKNTGFFEIPTDPGNAYVKGIEIAEVEAGSAGVEMTITFRLERP